MSSQIKSLLLFFIALLCLSYTGKAQSCDVGTRYINKTKYTDTICYRNKTEQSDYVFKNKYWIFRDQEAKDTMYLIEVNFNQITGKIEIVENNKQSNERSVKTLKFENKFNCFPNIEPVCCVKDYSFNDTSIVIGERNDDLLFTFADSNGMIFLHQYKTYDGTCNFSLDRFRNSYLEKHLKHASEYWDCYKKYINDSIKRINLEKDKIRTELSKCIKNLSRVKDSISTLVQPAGKRLQKTFSAKMDSIMVIYLLKGGNEKINDMVKYQIRVDLDKTVTIINVDTSNYFPNKPQWYKIIKQQIPSHFAEISGINEKIPLFSNDLMALISQNHRSRCLRDDISDTSVFSNILDSARRKIEEFPKQMEIPTLYNYTFAYNQRFEIKKWNLVNDFIIERHTKNEPANAAFIDTVHRHFPKHPNGRYVVGLKNGLINNSYQVFDESIGSFRRQYKYMTHYGASCGILINKNIDTYVDLIFIKHWYGVFAGFSAWGGLKEYLEAGTYFGPCNYLYFKIGVVYKNSTGKSREGVASALAGVSLIFPYAHAEGGYNFAAKCPYVTVGANFPLNK